MGKLIFIDMVNMSNIIEELKLPLIWTDSSGKKKVELTVEMQEKIIARWNDKAQNPPSIAELIKLCYGVEEDARSGFGKCVKLFLKNRGEKVPQTYLYQKKDAIQLSDDDKSLISNHVSSMTFVEIARLIFNNPDLNNLSKESVAVKEYIEKEIPDKLIYGNFNDVPQGAYNPPKTDVQALARINKYVDAACLVKEKLSNQQIKCVKTLISYLHTHRLLAQIGTYDTSSDIELFESTFIRQTWDKPDLTQSDIDKVVIYCTEVVISKVILRRINQFERVQDQQMNENNGKISMTLVEAIGGLRNEYNQCVERQRKILNEIETERSKRLNKNKGDVSILDLVQYVKEEENRTEMLRLGNLRKESLKKEGQRLSSLPDQIARIFGWNEDEFLN